MVEEENKLPRWVKWVVFTFFIATGLAYLIIGGFEITGTVPVP